MAVEADVQRLFARLERLKPTAEDGQAQALVGGVADGLRRRYKALDVDDAFAETEAAVVSTTRKKSELEASERQLLADTLRECGFSRVAERYDMGIVLDSVRTADNGRTENSLGPVSPIGKDATLTATDEQPPETEQPSEPPPAELFSSQAPVIRVTSPTPPVGSAAAQKLLQVPEACGKSAAKETVASRPSEAVLSHPPSHLRYDAAAEELELAQLRERHARAVQLGLSRVAAPPPLPPSDPPSCAEAAAAAVSRATARSLPLHSSAVAEAALRAAECDARAAAELRLSSTAVDHFLPPSHMVPPHPAPPPPPPPPPPRVPPQPRVLVKGALPLVSTLPAPLPAPSSPRFSPPLPPPPQHVSVLTSPRPLHDDRGDPLRRLSKATERSAAAAAAAKSVQKKKGPTGRPTPSRAIGRTSPATRVGRGTGTTKSSRRSRSAVVQAPTTVTTTTESHKLQHAIDTALAAANHSPSHAQLRKLLDVAGVSHSASSHGAHKMFRRQARQLEQPAEVLSQVHLLCDQFHEEDVRLRWAELGLRTRAGIKAAARSPV